MKSRGEAKIKSPMPGIEPGSLPAIFMRGQYDNHYTTWDLLLNDIRGCEYLYPRGPGLVHLEFLHK